MEAADTLMVVNLSNNLVKTKAKRLAVALHNLTNPKGGGGYQRRTFWNIIKHPKQNLGAMEFNAAYPIPINYREPVYDNDGNQTGWTEINGVVENILELVDILGYTIAQARNFIENNSTITAQVLLNNAPNLPNPNISIITKAQAEADGWYNYD